MKTTTQSTGPKGPEKRCEVFLVESGRVRKRWVSSISWRVHDRVARTLTGSALPDMVLLDTGPDQQAASMLEFFEKDMPRIRIEPEDTWLCGRAATAVVAIGVFEVLQQVVVAVAAALE